jgi:hypothetical protein
MEKQITISLANIQSYTLKARKSLPFLKALKHRIQNFRRPKAYIAPFTRDKKEKISLPQGFPADEAARVKALRNEGYRVHFILPDGGIPIYNFQTRSQGK